MTGQSDAAAEPWDGRPQNPERDGWHWVCDAERRSGEQVFAALWTYADDVERWEWWANGETWGPRPAARHWRYLGPCLLPHEVAELRERLAAAEARAAAERLAGREDVLADCRAVMQRMGDAFADELVGPDAFDEGCLAALDRVLTNGDALPAPTGSDALTEMLAQARRDALEEAAQVVDRLAQFNGSQARIARENADGDADHDHRLCADTAERTAAAIRRLMEGA